MKNIKSILTALLLAFSGSLFCAPPPPPSGSPGCWPPPCVPVDGGVVFLISAGVLLVAKKLYDLRQKSSITS